MGYNLEQLLSPELALSEGRMCPAFVHLAPPADAAPAALAAAARSTRSSSTVGTPTAAAAAAAAAMAPAAPPRAPSISSSTGSSLDLSQASNIRATYMWPGAAAAAAAAGGGGGGTPGIQSLDQPGGGNSGRTSQDSLAAWEAYAEHMGYTLPPDGSGAPAAGEGAEGAARGGGSAAAAARGVPGQATALMSTLYMPMVGGAPLPPQAGGGAHHNMVSQQLRQLQQQQQQQGGSGRASGGMGYSKSLASMRSGLGKGSATGSARISIEEGDEEGQESEEAPNAATAVSQQQQRVFAPLPPVAPGGKPALPPGAGAGAGGGSGVGSVRGSIDVVGTPTKLMGAQGARTSDDVMAPQDRTTAQLLESAREAAAAMHGALLSTSSSTYVSSAAHASQGACDGGRVGCEDQSLQCGMVPAGSQRGVAAHLQARAGAGGLAGWVRRGGPMTQRPARTQRPTSGSCRVTAAASPRPNAPAGLAQSLPSHASVNKGGAGSAQAQAQAQAPPEPPPPSAQQAEEAAEWEAYLLSGGDPMAPVCRMDAEAVVAANARLSLQVRTWGRGWVGLNWAWVDMRLSLQVRTAERRSRRASGQQQQQQLPASAPEGGKACAEHRCAPNPLSMQTLMTTRSTRRRWPRPSPRACRWTPRGTPGWRASPTTTRPRHTCCSWPASRGTRRREPASEAAAPLGPPGQGTGTAGGGTPRTRRSPAARHCFASALFGAARVGTGMLRLGAREPGAAAPREVCTLVRVAGGGARAFLSPEPGVLPRRAGVLRLRGVSVPGGGTVVCACVCVSVLVGAARLLARAVSRAAAAAALG